MKSSNEFENIVVDDLSAGLYGVHLDRKNHRIARVMKALILRHDFIDFLKELEEKGLRLEERTIPTGKKVKIWTIDFNKSGRLIRDYLAKIETSNFYQNLSPNWQEHFSYIAQFLLEYTYLDGFANHKNKNTILHNTIIFDDALNFPNITQLVFDKKLFWKFFEDSFYTDTQNAAEKHGGHPSNIVIGGNIYDEIPDKENIKPTNPKVCVLVFDDTTTIEELKDYLDKKKFEIFNSLRAMRPSREEKRLTSSSTFLRDVALYNQYEKYKKDGFKNADEKVHSWLQATPEHRSWLIDATSIRKVVSQLRQEIKEINSEK